MDTKKINLEGLKNVLSPKEMKNVKGGSGGTCHCTGGGIHHVDECSKSICEGYCGEGNVQNCNYGG